MCAHDPSKALDNVQVHNPVRAGECEYNDVPERGWWTPPTEAVKIISQKPDWQAASVVAVMLVCLCMFLYGVVYCKHRLLVRALFSSHPPDTSTAEGSDLPLPILPEEERMSVALSNMHYYSPNGAHILRGVTAIVNPGELIAVLGMCKTKSPFQHATAAW